MGLDNKAAGCHNIGTAIVPNTDYTLGARGRQMDTNIRRDADPHIGVCVDWKSSGNARRSLKGCRDIGRARREQLWEKDCLIHVSYST